MQGICMVKTRQTHKDYITSSMKTEDKLLIGSGGATALAGSNYLYHKGILDPMVENERM